MITNILAIIGGIVVVVAIVAAVVFAFLRMQYGSGDPP